MSRLSLSQWRVAMASGACDGEMLAGCSEWWVGGATAAELYGAQRSIIGSLTVLGEEELVLLEAALGEAPMSIKVDG